MFLLKYWSLHLEIIIPHIDILNILLCSNRNNIVLKVVRLRDPQDSWLRLKILTSFGTKMFIFFSGATVKKDMYLSH